MLGRHDTSACYNEMYLRCLFIKVSRGKSSRTVRRQYAVSDVGADFIHG